MDNNNGKFKEIFSSRTSVRSVSVDFIEDQYQEFLACIMASSTVNGLRVEFLSARSAFYCLFAVGAISGLECDRAVRGLKSAYQFCFAELLSRDE